MVIISDMTVHVLHPVLVKVLKTCHIILQSQQIHSHTTVLPIVLF